MTTVAYLVLGLAPLQIKAGLLMAFLVKIMEEVWIRIARKLLDQRVDLRKKRQQAGFRPGRGQGLDRVFQFEQSVQQCVFYRSVHGFEKFNGGNPAAANVKQPRNIASKIRFLSTIPPR